MKHKHKLIINTKREKESKGKKRGKISHFSLLQRNKYVHMRKTSLKIGKSSIK